MAVVAQSVSKQELRERIFGAVQDMYTEVATSPARTFHFPTGRWACDFLGYPASELDAIPATATESFAGVGYPFEADAIREGDRVLDIGAGSGTDALIAALRTGPDGEVFGVDLTDTMIEKAQKNIAESGLTNVRVVRANAESLPFDDESFDAVTSNGVLNLVPEKEAAFREIFRVLKTVGRLQISDIALHQEISESCRMNPELWAECIVGALPEEHYVGMLRDAGFADARVIRRGDYFERSPSEGTKRTAKQFGAISVTIAASKG